MGIARKLLCLVAFVGLSFGAAQAQRLQNPTGVVPGFNIEILVPLLQEMGGQTEILGSGANRMVGVVMPSGSRFIMGPTACAPTDGRCRGVSIQGLFPTGSATVASINRFNQQGTIPKAVLLGDRVVVFHYLIADFGMPRGNFDVHIGVWENALSRYNDFRNGGGIAQSVSLGHEVSHVGTTPSTVFQHPAGFVDQFTMDLPEKYFND
ncbi:MAG: YbjN domain-containing protein [Pseudomonadota bacterium]